MAPTPTLQSLRYVNDNNGMKLSVLDQLLLPKEKVYVSVPDVETAWKAIRTMQIRGAPLIAIVAVLSLAVDLKSNPATKTELESKSDDVDATVSLVKEKVDYLRTSRPTAVNLFNALDEVVDLMADVSKCVGKKGSDVVDCVTSYAEMMLERDVSDNKAIGRHGADMILKKCNERNVRMVTICNTGSLATAEFGTALGVVRELNARGKLQSITALETRPYNQGSRLTAFEIVEEDMPNGTLICDSMAAAFMKRKGADACVVGADRVCANGDTANKIGTYELAIVSAAHNVLFYVAAPFTTLDTKLASGDLIEIEERPAKELIDTSQAPSSIKCWNPAFDVTPAKLIDGIITEKGVIQRGTNGVFDIKSFVKAHS